MAKKGGPDTQTTVTSTEPPAWMRPYIEGALQTGQDLYRSQPMMAPGPAINPDQMAGINAIRGAAGNFGLSGAARDYAGDVLGGQYLQADHLRRAAQPDIDRALQGVRSGFELGGGTGGSMEAIAAGEGVARALGDTYNRERAMQSQMAMAAPQLDAAQMVPGQALMNIGDYTRRLQDRPYMEPWQRYQTYVGTSLGTPGGLAGGVTTGQQPIYNPSPFSQILGGGLSLLPMFF